MTSLLLTPRRFQYVALQFDALRNLSSMPLIRQALRDLPAGLDATYDRILLRTGHNYQPQVANTLKWLALSERAFRIEELGHIFIIHPEPPGLRWSEQLFDPRDALKYLSGLVHTWNETESRGVPPDLPLEYHKMGESVTIMRLRLAHFSIKEYLMSHRITQGPAAQFGFSEADAHLHIARCCLEYHLQRDALGVRVSKDEDLEGWFYQLEDHLRSGSYWLDKYAAANWSIHLEMVPRERWPPEVRDAAARALGARSSALLETLCLDRDQTSGREILFRDHRQGRQNLMMQLPQRFTAASGFAQLTDMLISSHKYLTQEDLDNTLKEATDSDRTAVINLLIEKGARIIADSVDTKTEDAGSQAAAEIIDIETDGFNLLIVKDHRGVEKRGSPLQRACYHGDFEAVQILLNSGTDVNAKGGYYGTALQAACAAPRWETDVNLLTLLLERGTDVNAQGGHFGNALQASCYEHNLEFTAKLLEWGADVNSFGGEYGSALQAAAASSTYSNALLMMLLSNGAEVNQRGGVYGYYGTPLQAMVAQEGQHIDSQVSLLLDHGADVNIEGGHFGTALVAACSQWGGDHCGRDMALLLLERGASVHAQGGDFGSAWHAAALHRENGWEDVLQRMLDDGVDINNAQGRRHATALEAALAVSEVARPWEENYEMKADTGRIRFLLDRGAQVNVRGGQYGFPLQAACCESEESATHLDRCFTGVNFLLDNCPDIDVNAHGGLHGTALQAAAYWGQTRSVKALLQHGADVNQRGGQCRSALNAAIFRHFWDIVEILLEAGATPDSQLLPEPDEEWLARVGEEEGRGAVERYHVFWKKHTSIE